MELLQRPNIKIYSRRVHSYSPSPRASLALLEEDEFDDIGKTSPMSARIEDDLNWASKYLRSDRSSSVPRKTPPKATVAVTEISSLERSGKPKSLYSDKTTDYYRRSKSPASLSESSMSSSRSSIHDDLLRMRRGSTSPVTQRTRVVAPARNGYVRMCEDLPPKSSSTYVSPNVYQPHTRTYADLDSVLATNSVNQKPKLAISDTRKRLRSLLCRSRNDPHYFDSE